MRPAVVAIVLVSALVALAAALRPRDDGHAYSEYFADLNRLLRREGQGRPVLVLDLDRLDGNLRIVNETLRSPRGFRVVAKSLPSLPLLRYVFERSNTRRAMVFHEPSIRELALAFPDSELLLGKPMPIQAARHFYASFPTDAAFSPARQLQWLVDDEARLAQYADFAAESRIAMRVNLEIDVGLHRGGLRDPGQLRAVFERIEASPWLTFSGFMGYDAHVASAPPVLSSVGSALEDVRGRYRAFVDEGRRLRPDWFTPTTTLNGAGSKTYMLYKADDPLNDLALGSGLVMPTDFDVPTLTRHQPALFIATPVLKVNAGTTIPYLESLTGAFSWWNPNWQRSYFVYGGGWLADFVAPTGLRDNAIYGFSTNQAIVNGSAATALNVDDHVFLRPRQSEQVMQMFGEILAVRGGEVVERWPAMAW